MMGNLLHEPSSSSEATATLTPPAGSSGSFAFLVHSQDTLTKKLPPTVDNKPVARQRRKRTSPEDQAILEAEYLKNPKPDREARMEIVGRVALGEKELQIWFQNRRQNTRKKTVSPVSTLPDAVDETTLPSSSADSNESFASTSSSFSSEDTIIDQSATATSRDDGSHRVEKSSQVSLGSNNDSSLCDTIGGVNSQQNTQSVFSSGSFSNRAWSAEDKISKVRLSWSLDGRVKIATKEDGSPPRPSSKPVSRTGLRRSYSANTAGNLGLDLDLFNPVSHFKSNRRPQKNNAWTVYGSDGGLDGVEGSGSAADAIKALRSKTDNARMVGTKRASQGEAESPTKKAKAGSMSMQSCSSTTIDAKATGPKAPKPVNARVPLLSRANSSMAKLSSEKKKKVDMEEEENENDSDKENWHCGGTQPLSRRRQRRPLRSQRANARVASLQIFEDPETETEPEKEGGGEDLDAVQNLLSLSQGQWK
ncbi:MAG: hypothetical protein M1829_004027 [Trizodia sp. TS-e1964]|nr:MAG: hypothetical protein M1829_004027 [Trizodia sp. TS-e1964]